MEQTGGKLDERINGGGWRRTGKEQEGRGAGWELEERGVRGILIGKGAKGVEGRGAGGEGRGAQEEGM